MSELNKKLAEFQGVNVEWLNELANFEKGNVINEDLRAESIPKYTKSLDTSFPLILAVLKRYGMATAKSMLHDWVETIMTGKEPALALCLAISKLIDVKEL